MSEFDWTPYEGGAAVAFNDVGDSVIGVVQKIEVKQGRHGEVPVVTLLDERGEDREVWCGAAVLRSEMARSRPQVGDKVKITLTGMQNVGQPSPMKVFEVKVKRPDAPAPAPVAETQQAPGWDDGTEPF